MPLNPADSRLFDYLSYLFRAKGPHALHSPLLFSMYHEVIKPAARYRIEKVEALRNSLRKDQSLLEVTDFKSGNQSIKSIGSIAKSSACTPKFAAFLSLLVKFLDVRAVLETGTSVGLSTAYLAQHAQQVTTIEGSAALAQIAAKNLEQLGCTNVQIRHGDLYRLLEEEIVKTSPDFYFLDADHRSSAIAFCLDLILRHTPETKCIVIHDIYWSNDMKTFWQSLKKDPRFALSIDLFQAGLLFPERTMEKQHFTLRF